MLNRIRTRLRTHRWTIITAAVSIACFLLIDNDALALVAAIATLLLTGLAVQSRVIALAFAEGFNSQGDMTDEQYEQFQRHMREQYPTRLSRLRLYMGEIRDARRGA